MIIAAGFYMRQLVVKQIAVTFLGSDRESNQGLQTRHTSREAVGVLD